MNSSAPPDPLQTSNDTRSLKQRSVMGAAVTFVAQGLRFALQFGSQIALARLLTPGDFGLIAMIAPLLSLVQIFNELGLSQATIQRPEISHRELSSLFWVNIAISASLAAVMALSSPLVAWFYGQPRLIAICLCLALLLVLSGMSAQQIALMNRRMQFSGLASIDVGCTVVAVAVGIAAAWWGMSYWSLVLMQAANSLTILLMAWFLSNWRPSWPRRDDSVWGLLKFGGHLTGYNLIQYAGNNLDSVLIGKLGGNVALGLYDRAFKLVAAPIWQISLPVDRVAISLLARLQGAADRYRRAYLQMLQVLLLVTVPAVVFTTMAAHLFVPLLLGQGWTEAAPIVSWLAIATAFAPLSISSYWLFVSQHRVAEQVRYACIKTVISIAALLVGLPWGALGVAKSYAIFAVLVHGSLLWGATRTGPVNRTDIVRACYPIVIGAVAAAVVLELFELHVQDFALPAIQRLLLEALLAYAVCGLALLCSPGGLRILRDLWRLRTIFATVPAGS